MICSRCSSRNRCRLGRKTVSDLLCYSISVIIIQCNLTLTGNCILKGIIINRISILIRLQNSISNTVDLLICWKIHHYLNTIILFQSHYLLKRQLTVTFSGEQTCIERIIHSRSNTIDHHILLNVDISVTAEYIGNLCIIVIYISRCLSSTTISTDHNLIGLLFTLTIRLRYIVVVKILIIHLDLRILLKRISILIQLKYIIGAIRNIRPCSCTTGSILDMDFLHFSVRGISIRIKVKPNIISYILLRFQRNHIPVIINIIDPLRNLDLCMLLRITYRLRISLYIVHPALLLICKRNGDQHR